MLTPDRKLLKPENSILMSDTRKALPQWYRKKLSAAGKKGAASRLAQLDHAGLKEQSRKMVEGRQRKRAEKRALSRLEEE